MRRNDLISTSGFKKELKFGFSMPENLYQLDFFPKNAILTLFLPFFSTAHAQKRPDFYFRFKKGAQIRIQHARKPV